MSALSIVERKQRHAELEAKRRANMSEEERDNLKVINYNWRQMVNSSKVGCKKNLKCKDPIIGTTRYCFEHWLERAYVSKGDRFSVTVEELKKLWDKQQGRCAITKCILVPGTNVALDHIIPVTKKGTNNIENLRFINFNVNLLKHNMSDIELKSILNEIGPNLLEWAKGE